MVERKKTGLSKAWKQVSHLFSCTTLISHYLISVQLSMAYVPLQSQCLLCRVWKTVDLCVKIFAHNERLIMYETKTCQNWVPVLSACWNKVSHIAEAIASRFFQIMVHRE